MALTKDKLVIRLQTQLGLTKPESRQMVERLFGLMKDTLTNGEDLLVSGFGKFLVRKKNERRGRNPQTKKSLILAARKVLVFKTSGVLRNRINESLFLDSNKSSKAWAKAGAGLDQKEANGQAGAMVKTRPAPSPSKV